MARQMAFNSCVFGFQGWFNRQPADDEVAICIADRAEKLERSLKKGFATLRRTGLPTNPLVTHFNFIDAYILQTLPRVLGCNWRIAPRSLSSVT
jgi:hypothetical protein